MNDLPVVVSALHARPDWVISSNRVHWNDQLARSTGLRILSPSEFLSQLSPAQQSSTGAGKMTFVFSIARLTSNDCGSRVVPLEAVDL
jgi:hypothetical protein